jgi:S-adenosylmethionine:tRNA ribosyltransferase-isomerase
MNVPSLMFDLPEDLNAKAPAERRGLRRDFVKLMVLDKQTGKKSHVKFYDLIDYLNKGDLLVLNASRTVPAVLKCHYFKADSLIPSNVEIRLAHRIDDQTWEALIVSGSMKI